MIPLKHPARPHLARLLAIAILLCSFFLQSASAYTTWQTVEGPVKLYFGQPDDAAKSATLETAKIEKLDEAIKFHVTFENQSDVALMLKLSFRSVETIEFPDAETLEPDSLSKTVKLEAKETKTIDFEIVARPGTYSAHYPVHLDVEFDHEGHPHKANIVLVVETKVPAMGTPDNPQLGRLVDDPSQLPLTVLPSRGGLALSTSNRYRGIWYYDQKPNEIQTLPIGFTGTIPHCGANISRQNIHRGGMQRQSIGMHPPYRGGVGCVATEYRIQLPDTTPISLSFFGAMRDVLPPETPSDGVAYRVYVDGERLYDRFISETTWIANEIDLSRFAGKEIILKLESDPGPKRNTNCDSCFWGNILLFAGEKPTVLSAEEKSKLFEENLTAIKSGKSMSGKTQIFKLEGGLVGAVSFGLNGFVDGVIGLGNAEKQVQFDGLRLWCKGQSIADWPTALAAGPWSAKHLQNDDAPPRPARGKKGKPYTDDGDLSSKNQWAQDIEIDGESATLFFEILKKGPALQFVIDASQTDWINRIEFGPATYSADKVYYGHGYCITKPKRFVAGAGGHDLSTSHVGMDFENGLSVLQASSFPPDRFVVAPDAKLYTLSVHPATTMTLLPGLSGAMDCAIRYRPICGKTAAPGVAEKAGRFVFDIWGGSYKDHVETLEHAVRYGLTDSMFIVHNWQRWGYDNRLPDIWPPNPRWASSSSAIGEMQQALKIANENGILYGVHDNYIDFYPDAEDYSFDELTFDANGQPRKAWNNHGIDAQSYQFRPDRIQRFLERNLNLIVPNLPMSTYFVDVFTSIPPIDYHDREGNFHSRLESQAAWSKAFDTIRDRLSKANEHFPTATTVSEAGMDSLIGHLDGADCQFMLLSSEPGYYRTKLDCESWARVPWFDAVHHTTFSLHGAGYADRYAAGRSRSLHGIESDDYIVSEILTGHALMVDQGSRTRGAVRKYWLAQDLIRHLADKEIIGIGGTPTRRVVVWSDGTSENDVSFIWINLDQEDWINPEVAGRRAVFSGELILPQYGFFTNRRNIHSSQKVSAGIYRQNGRVVERSSIEKDGIQIHYVNARQKTAGAENPLPVTPRLSSFEYQEGNRFVADFEMNDQNGEHHDLCLFVHCVEPRMNWHQKLKEGVLGGGYSQLKLSGNLDCMIGRQEYPNQFSVPGDLPAGRYYLVAGLYDQKGNGRRAKLLGFDTGSDRYAVAWLVVERNGESLGEGKLNKVSKISVEPFVWEDEHLAERLLPPAEPVDFGFCRTKGAFRIEMDDKNQTALVILLPEEPLTEISLNIPSDAKSVKALDADGNELRDVSFENGKHPNQPQQKTVRFTTEPDEFAYKVDW